MITISGSVHVPMDDDHNKKTRITDKAWKGLLVAPGLWRDLEIFAGDTVCMVLASEKYDAKEYIRNYYEEIPRI